jgi:hypothetical protein
MSWTVACFCGTVFQAPADCCPTCHTPLPEVTRNHPRDNDARPVPATIATAQVLELRRRVAELLRLRTSNRRPSGSR